MPPPKPITHPSITDKEIAAAFLDNKENKTTIIDNIEAYYKENKIKMDLQIEKDLPEYIYTYNAIGLTIWFEKEEIVDISVELPQ